MQYKIMAEAHEGVASCDEACWAVIEADSPEDAMRQYMERDPRVTWFEGWKCWLFNMCRKVWPEPVGK